MSRVDLMLPGTEPQLSSGGSGHPLPEFVSQTLEARARSRVKNETYIPSLRRPSFSGPYRMVRHLSDADSECLLKSCPLPSPDPSLLLAGEGGEWQG